MLKIYMNEPFATSHEQAQAKRLVAEKARMVQLPDFANKRIRIGDEQMQ